MDLSIIIVNYNSLNDIRECISSIYKYLRNIDLEVIVVDNNSPNRNIAELNKEFESVKLLLLAENKGFGFANNRGTEIASSANILFLNPDTYLVDDSVISLLKFAGENKFGVLCPVIYNPDGSLQYFHDNFHTIGFLISEAFNLHYKKIREVVKADENKIKDQYFEIDWALGAAILIKKSLFEKIDGFDERFFLYYEDADIAKKAADSGLKNYCFTGSGIVHKLSTSTGHKQFVKFNVHRSRLVYVMKYLSFFERLLVRVVFTFSIFLRVLALPFSSALRKEGGLLHYLKCFRLYLYSRKYILSSGRF